MKLVCLVLPKLFFQPKQRCNGLGIDNLARHGHANSLLQRKKSQCDSFVLLRLRCAFLESAGQINSHALIQKARAHIEKQRFLPSGSPVTSLFYQFAFRSGQLLLPGSTRPAGSSHIRMPAAYRYCRSNSTRGVRPELSSGSTTIDPECRITSRRARTLPGSSTSSVITLNTGPRKAVLEEITRTPELDFLRFAGMGSNIRSSSAKKQNFETRRKGGRGGIGNQELHGSTEQQLEQIDLPLPL